MNASIALFGVNVKKTRSVSRRLVQAAVAEGVSDFNFGNIETICAMQKAKISPGKKSIDLAKVRDRCRKLKIAHAKSERLKIRRKYLKMKRK